MNRAAFILSFILCCALSVIDARAQNTYVATNCLDYLYLVTFNAEFGVNVSSKWSVYLKGKYNPFSFNFGKRIQHKQATVAAGVKYWFWYTNSGWFVNSHIGYSNYNVGGIIDRYGYQGNAYSLTLGGGYSLILSKKLNLDFGVGVNAGYTNYKKYMCPTCGKFIEKKKKVYVAPSNLLVQLSVLL